MKITKLMYSTV